MRRSRGAARSSRGDSGESLALLVVWPALLTAILLMLVHAFIVANARAEAEVAASEGLRSAWRAIADADFSRDPTNPAFLYVGADPHPEVQTMVDAAEAAVAQAAATKEGWRWWTPGAAEVRSDWCHPYPVTPPVGPPGSFRPFEGDTGWLRVVVAGEVYGPLAALWPNRWDTVYSVAQGPAVLAAPAASDPGLIVPAELPAC
ncbi:hypothetical protein [Candidatus Poriferisodalis sp.]|uniref:hypothetical protein n=1 Tax=Candidatus Poriferisodalis sp. TaxID=3101277 RepID=UPI003C6EE128